MNIQTIVQTAAEALREGKTLLYPTDTIWGVGCDARRSNAVERLYALKERDHSKSMLILCTPALIGPGPWCDTGDGRPTTYILPEPMWRAALHTPVADNLVAADGSLGVRIPNHAFCRALIDRLGAPLVSTSANLSGRPSPATYEDIDDELRRRVDHCVPPLAELLSTERRGSRILRLEADGSTTVLRP